MPKGISSFGIDSLKMMKEVCHGGTIGLFLVWAETLLLMEAFLLGYSFDVGFVGKAEWADNLEMVMIHLHERTHGLCFAFEGDIHQIGDDEVVVMMPEGYLIEAFFLRKKEEGFAPVPCTEEASRLSLVGALIE